jgi:cell division protein FtsB
MEPLNQIERKEAIRNFLIVNGVLVILFVLGAYFLFASPLKVMDHHLSSYVQDENQQKDLNEKVKGIHGNIFDLVQNDKDRLTVAPADLAGQAALQNTRQNLEDKIRRTLEDIKSDTTRALRPIVLTNYQNYIQLLDVTLNYRQTIDFLQKSIADANAKAGTLDDANRKLTEQDAQLKTENMIASAAKGAAPAGGGGGGGADPTTQNMLKAKDAQIADLTDKYNACNTALQQYKTYRGVPPTTTTAQPASGGGGSSASILFDEANDLLQKGKAESSPSNRDSYYFVSQEILKKIKSSYPDQGAWKAKYTEVEGAIKKAGGF